MLLWLAWLLYCVPLAPSWTLVFLSLRNTGRSRRFAWLVAAVIATLWPLFVRQLLAWRAARPQSAVGDQVEREFKALYP